MWLQGVEEMQDSGWTPTPAQWTKIREKIDQIHESSPLKIAQPAPVPTYRALMPESAAPALPAGPTMFAAPSVLSAPQQMPMAAPQPMSQTAQQLFGTNPSLPVKAPTIDTSNGTYVSGFA